MTTNLHHWWWTIPVLAGALVIANVTASNLVATSGQDLKKLELTAQELISANGQLRQRISQASSLVYLARQADQLGFLPPTQIIYLGTGQSLARRQ